MMHLHRISQRFYGLGFVLLGLVGASTLPASAAIIGATLEAERDISLCSNENFVHARPRVCNDSAEGETFAVDFGPLPAGIYPQGNCSVDGPTQFFLAETRPVLVPAGACIDLHLEVRRPPGMTSGQTSCYRVEVEDQISGEVLTAQSSFYDSGAICSFPDGATSTELREGWQVPMVFSLHNTTSQGRTVNYRFESVSSNGPSTVLLNGSGGVVDGEADVPAGGEVAISVDVALSDYEGEVRHDVLLRDRDSNELFTSRGFETFAFGCNADTSTLCLDGGRFEVKTMWRDFIGQVGNGHAMSLTEDTGYFWFFSPNNVEVMIKVLDGRYINDSWWVFFGALSSVEYTVTVRDTYTGESKSYHNPSSHLASIGDTDALPGYEPIQLIVPATLPGTTLPGMILPGMILPRAGQFVSEVIPQLESSPRAEGLCIATDSVFCVQDGRFAVEVSWVVPPSESGHGHAELLTPETGYFWFFSPNNIELVLKVLDGREINGHWWVFFGALSDVDYTLKVTDTQTGDIKIFHNPQGLLASVADTEAFVD